MVANILPQTSSPRPWGWGQNSTFSEHGHVAYQIKWNHECSNMVANILPENPLPTTMGGGGGPKVKIQLFQNIVMLHIKFKWNHECSNMVANILPT